MEKYQDQLSIFSSLNIFFFPKSLKSMKMASQDESLKEKNIFIGPKLTISLNCWDKEIVKAGTLRCMSNTGLGKTHDKHWRTAEDSETSLPYPFPPLYPSTRAPSSPPFPVQTWLVSVCGGKIVLNVFLNSGLLVKSEPINLVTSKWKSVVST